jgi:hypothetical protein
MSNDPKPVTPPKPHPPPPPPAPSEQPPEIKKPAAPDAPRNF